ncbi:hypothetical protein FSST1_002978 [Fusarium sambucinum]
MISPLSKAAQDWFSRDFWQPVHSSVAMVFMVMQFRHFHLVWSLRTTSVISSTMLDDMLEKCRFKTMFDEKRIAVEVSVEVDAGADLVVTPGKTVDEGKSGKSVKVTSLISG